MPVSKRSYKQTLFSADRKLSLIHFSLLFSCFCRTDKEWKNNQAERQSLGGGAQTQSQHVDHQITVTTIWQQQTVLGE